ncbi:hydroxymethylglutaryl-CoA reductase, degradative [Spongiivirga citrea]|uniref:3-hydroxy-3-methylglutaryl coenzyme A reductase n=1 Tax=Spongiivirga citrea TaxID=1481457 RepID=A0A6M0CMM8_9FLAO|nr:hydroxymethylglutaryl-CoA reductase, degradative [Spongiivirga citrea]NER18213.1 hydroxymethylglutaryl-CoA reductase, degradative [Spongiivirga citrea]
MTIPINGFSKLTKEEKISWLADNYFSDIETGIATIKSYWNTDSKLQQLHDEFIENTITNFYLPLGIAPNFLINNRLYSIPMAIEESSVVAAASNAAKFWLSRGGFHAEVISTTKIGQVHFIFKGDNDKLKAFFKVTKSKLIQEASELTRNMEKRGGGILDISLRDKTADMEGYYQLHCSFETLDAMGANFINSCLEQFATTLKKEALSYANFSESEQRIEVIMSILSNYVPECLVKVGVECPVESLFSDPKQSEAFAERFVTAVNIAAIEPYRAVTHNKGIMNGIDAVVVATGNDFRAVEAGVHAYAARNGNYASLSHASLENGVFKFWMELPLALGTVGGLTKLHPLVKLNLDMLGNPTAKDLMMIVATAGLAQNFAALRSLTTTGIQEGHMKMHLGNILSELKATSQERDLVEVHFKNNTISHSAVVDFVNELRKN